MQSLSKIFAALIVVMLVVVNFRIEYTLEPLQLNVGIELNTAEANDDIADHKLMTEECWATGEEFEICRHNPPWYCIISAQGACSRTNPEQN